MIYFVIYPNMKYMIKIELFKTPIGMNKCHNIKKQLHTYLHGMILTNLI